jgi:HTH-type transcriptional regulator / antitoxin HipB
MMQLATRVRERRTELRLTQPELAELAEVSERFVRLVESGKDSVRLDKLQPLLAVLGLEFQLKLRGQ